MLKPVIGLEIHLQLDTRTKMFSPCPTGYFGQMPNSFTDPFTLGLPGTLPSINEEAVEKALMFGLALNCQVEGPTRFHRKHYFYPDSPKNYQISQYDQPIAHDGHLTVEGQTIRIVRAHLEDDAGKLIHPNYAPHSLLDLNRAGMPLIEMVTGPDIESPEMAKTFLVHIQAIAQALGISDATPEEGKMRCDVNISLHHPGEPLGTKVEIKNLNSFKSVGRAIEYETERQERILSKGGRISQDTLGWDEGGQKTYLMRTKEGVADYRYMPDPDLPVLYITREKIDAVRKKMPELPMDKHRRYVSLGIRESDAQNLAFNLSGSRMLDETLEGYGGSPQQVVNWLVGDIAGHLAAESRTLSESGLKPDHLRTLVEMIDRKVISGKMAKSILPEVIQGMDPVALVERDGLSTLTDTQALEAAIDEVLAQRPDVVQKARENPKAINALFGPIMQKTQGKAAPELVRELLLKRLTAPPSS